MIVSRRKTQVVFGMIAAVFTAFMAYVQLRNISESSSVEDGNPGHVEPAAAADRQVAPDESQIEMNQNAPAPGKPKKPFLIKPVDGRDRIEGEYLASFFDEHDRKTFIDLVLSAGGEVAGSSDYGNTVKVRLRDDAQFRELLKQGPVPLDYSANFRVYFPERPDLEGAAPDRFYGVFGSSALRWLGLEADHRDWGSGVKVAVLDNGVYPHPALKPDGVSFIDIVGDRFAEGKAAWHGTAVASIIAGWHPEMMGVAPGVQILSVRVCGGDGTGDVFDVAQGLMKALEQGAGVINISLGTYGDSFVLRRAVEEAVRRGAVVVASAGNDGQEGVAYPAAYEGVIGVSSVDSLGQKMYFGNTGQGVDLCAPGYSIKAAGSRDQFVEDFTGTSASAPFVSGMAAVLMARGLKAGEAAERIVSLADDAGEAGRDNEFGNGILDIRRIEEYGKPGIRDAAIASMLLKGGVVSIVFQNRGTEVLEGARIAVKSGERYINFDIGRTLPGQSVAREFEIRFSDYSLDGMLTVTAEILQTGLRDIYPGNNARKLIALHPDRVGRRAP